MSKEIQSVESVIVDSANRIGDLSVDNNMISSLKNQSDGLVKQRSDSIIKMLSSDIPSKLQDIFSATKLMLTDIADTFKKADEDSSVK